MKRFFEQNINLFVVFLTGMAVLVVEVIAVRILSPYFGNTIFTVSSVLSTILLALSLGYYFGGKLADKFPDRSLFYLIISCSGLAVFVLQILLIFILPSVANLFNLIWGPLIVAPILFLPTSFLLGMLSPLVIKLQSMICQDQGIGTVSGKVFFWSTLGSIVGSLLAGFVLIPTWGIRTIVSGLVIGLLILGLIGLILTVSKPKRKILIIISVIIVIGVSLFYLKIKAKESVIYSIDGIYEKIIIYDGVYNNRPTRFLKLGKNASSAMFLDGDDLVFNYTKYYDLYQAVDIKVENALVIGGGAYSVPKKLHEEIADAKIDVLEVETQLYEASKKYFDLPEDDNLKNYVVDGRHFLNNSKIKYDYIFADAYNSLFTVPTHLTTKEFFQIARNSMEENGIFIMNAIGALTWDKESFLLSEINTFGEVFDNYHVIAVDSKWSTRLQNFILVGINGDKKLKIEDPERIDKIVDLGRFEMKNYKIITDNFAPVDYLNSKMYSKYLKNSTGEVEGNEMMGLINKQIEMGPRYFGSEGRTKLQDFLTEEIQIADESDVQEFEYDGQKAKNFIARFEPKAKKRYVIASHYDTFKNGELIVPGANDGASGTAVMLGLMTVLHHLNNVGVEFDIGVDFVFFDLEEVPEGIAEKDWKPQGSKYFVDNINKYYSNNEILGVIVVDMIGDANLNVYKEENSMLKNDDLYEKIYKYVKYGFRKNFSDNYKYSIQDDQSIFLEKEIPAVLLIDFDYKYLNLIIPKSLPIDSV